jgi:hypothetical protein
MAELHTADLIADGDLADDVELPGRLAAAPGLLRITLAKIQLYLATALRLIPAGGAVGQVLTKASADDYDAGWADAAGGGGGGGFTVLDDQILAANSATVTFSAIPATYSDLIIEFEVRRSDSAADLEFYLQFNGDTAANYQYYTENRTGNANTSPASMLRCGTAGGSTLTAGVYGTGEFTIFGYSRTDRFKHLMAPANWFPQLSVVDKILGVWRSNAAVASIVLLGTGGFTFAAGSRFRLLAR